MMKIRKTAADTVFDVSSQFFLVMALILVIYPLYFVCIASVSDPNEVLNGEVLLLPGNINLDGYYRIFQDAGIWQSYLNTVLYTVAGTAFALVLTLTVAFPISRKYFSGRRVISIILLITMYFNGGLVPTYMLAKKLHLVGSPLSVIIIGSMSILNVIITRSFFESNIPHELDEAAYIDGSSHLQYFMKVVLPLSKVIIAVMLLFYGVGYWNDYFKALIYISNAKLYPLQVVLREILFSTQLSSQMQSSEDIMYASHMQSVAALVKYGIIIVATIPVLLIYPFLQKYFVKGIMIGSLKG